MKSSIHFLCVLAISLLAWIMIPAQQMQAQPCTNEASPGVTLEYYPGNPFGCFKVDPPTAGTFYLGDGSITITITDTYCGKLLDWEVSGPVIIEEIWLKGGPGANKYIYPTTPPFFTADYGLHTPLNGDKYFGLSHFEICWSPCTPCQLVCPSTPFELGCNPVPPTCDDALAEVSDNCNGTLEKTCQAGIVNENGCYRSQTFTITATDDCGNPSQCDVTYTWKVDITPPTLACPDDYDFGCNPPSTNGIPNAIPTSVNWTDVCDGSGVTYSFTDNGPNVTDCNYTLIRTFYQTDECGNQGSCSVTYTWKVDLQAPTIRNIPDLTLNCEDPIPTNSVYLADDVCDGTILAEYQGNPEIPESCEGQGGTWTRVWRAVDICGNTATREQLITCLPCGVCTYTQGYWKTHSEFGPAPYDDTWAQLPNGASTPFFNSGKNWYEVFQTPIPSEQGRKQYYQLAHQYMAAYLNILRGSDDSEISAAMTWSFDGFTAWTSDVVPQNQRGTATSTANLLDDYNNGVIGPGHCEDELPFYTGEQIQILPEEAGDLQLRAIPNPFNGEVQFTMHVPYASHVTLEVFNANGQRVALVFSAYLEAGQERTVTFNGSNLPEGLYIYRFTTDKEVKSGQLISLE